MPIINEQPVIEEEETEEEFTVDPEVIFKDMVDEFTDKFGPRFDAVVRAIVTVAPDIIETCQPLIPAMTACQVASGESMAVQDAAYTRKMFELLEGVKEEDIVKLIHARLSSR